MTGKIACGAGSSKLRRRPSHGRQPKFAPRPPPFLTKSISSTSSCPTSPIDEVVGGAVEGEAPRVAQPVGVDLAAGAGAPDERVRGRDRVRLGARLPRVDAQDLAQRRAERLRVAARRRAGRCRRRRRRCRRTSACRGRRSSGRRCGWARGRPCAARAARCWGRRGRRWRGGTPRSPPCRSSRCSRRRTGPTARSPGAKAIESRPCSPPAVTFERMSRNGWACGLAAADDDDLAPPARR